MLMRKLGKIHIILCICFAALTGCSGGGADAVIKEDAEALVVYCPHPLKLINPIAAEFESRTGIRVKVVSKGTGELLQMVEEGEEPHCDIFWGGSLSTTITHQELFEPYISSNEGMIREEFKNAEGNMTRFTDIPSILMLNTNLTGELPLEGYEDLLRPELKGKIAMCSPLTSSSAYEHLLNMLYAMGDGNPEQGWSYVKEFCENLDGQLLSGSSEVYKGVAAGRYAVGLTFEEGAAHYVAADSPIKLVYMKEGVISKPDVVCIAKGARNREEAEKFVDFVTGKDAQTIISGKLNRRSVRMDVAEPDYLPEKESLHLIYDEEQEVKQNKEKWLLRFSEIYEKTLK